MREPISPTEQVATFWRSDLENLGLNPRTRDTLESLPLSRDTLVQAVNGLTDDLNDVEDAAFVVFDSVTPLLTNTRLLASSPNIDIAHDASQVTADLTDTGVTADTYGEPTKLVVLAIDAKGRVTAASEVDLNSDNVTEGTVHLFFTQARARASVSGSSGISYNSGTGDFTLNQAFARGLLSGGSGINYNSGTGAIATTGFNGGPAVYTNFTFVNGICTAAS